MDEAFRKLKVWVSLDIATDVNLETDNEFVDWATTEKLNPITGKQVFLGQYPWNKVSMEEVPRQVAAMWIGYETMWRCEEEISMIRAESVLVLQRASTR